MPDSPAAQLRPIRHVALDMDGTLYRGRTVFPFARPALDALTAAGVGYTLLTNNSSLGVADYLRKTTRVTSRLPDSYEMRHLRVTRMTPVLCLEAINVDTDGVPVEYGLTRFSSSRVQIVIDTLPV